MFSLKNILKQTFGKIAILTIIFIIITTSILIFFIIPTINTAILNERKHALHEATQLIAAMFSALNQKEEKGLISKDEAQKIALNSLNEFRYGKNADDYFWINDINNGVILSHPFEHLIGTNFENLTDVDGYNFGKDMMDIAKNQKHGIITYQWPSKQNSKIHVTKISHVTAFEPWGWMIGTGMYINDVQEEIHSITQKLITAFTFILFLMIGLLIFLVKAGSAIEKEKNIAEQKYMSLITHLPIAVFRIELLKDNASSVPLLWNDALIHLFEFPTKNYINENNIHIHDFLVDKKVREKIVGTALNNGKVIGQEIELQTFTGKKVWIKIFVCYIEEDGSRFLDISMENITEKRKATELLKKSNVELQKVNEMQNEIISVTSHELRTPLTVMKGFTSILLQEQKGNLNKSQKKYLSKILKNTNILLEMITNMLDLEKIKTGKMQPKMKLSNINDLILNIFNDFEPRCQKEKKLLTLDFSVSPLLIKTDPEKLKRILINLIDNAIKFTHSENGEIKIFTKEVTHDKIEIHVKDNGVGISKEDLNKIFKKFNQVQNPLKELHNGSGLGLSIVKQLTQQLQGNINVTSIVGEGSDFYITLLIKK